MSEPTIDAMLRWLVTQARTDDPHVIAIRAILEQHRLRIATDKTQITVWGKTLDDLGEIVRQHRDQRQIELQAIRAFVERVQLSELDWQEAMLTELAEMEKEGPATK